MYENTYIAYIWVSEAYIFLIKKYKKFIFQINLFFLHLFAYFLMINNNRKNNIWNNWSKFKIICDIKILI